MKTTETNKKLAEFLGWETNNVETITPEEFRTIVPFKTINGDGYFTTTIFKNEDLKFHNDWSWLMLVWEAIPSQTENYCFNASFDTTEIVVYDKDGDQRITTIYCDKPCNTLIERIYNLCSMFVDWYNGAQKELR